MLFLEGEFVRIDHVPSVGLDLTLLEPHLKQLVGITHGPLGTPVLLGLRESDGSLGFDVKTHVTAGSPISGALLCRHESGAAGCRIIRSE